MPSKFSFRTLINLFVELSITGLVHVEVAGAGLRGVESGALDALRLQSLALPENRIHSLPDKAFRYLSNTITVCFIKIVDHRNNNLFLFDFFCFAT